jgi:hypothetical protein
MSATRIAANFRVSLMARRSVAIQIAQVSAKPVALSRLPHSHLVTRSLYSPELRLMVSFGSTPACSIVSHRSGNGDRRAALILRRERRRMPMFAMGEKLRALPLWREIDVFAKLRPHCVTEIEQDEEHCLDAMIPWRDPAERSRILRCRRHALVDDNPTSG